VTLFNGKDLTGRDGDPRLWQVEDRMVVGTCVGPADFKQNTFLIWCGGTLKDFELRATVRVGGDHNSGIQYRRRPLPSAGPWKVSTESGCQSITQPTQSLRRCRLGLPPDDRGDLAHA